MISVRAGVFGISLPRFLLFTTLGTSLWTTLLAGAGYLFQEQYGIVADYLNPVTNIIVGLVVAAYLYQVATWRVTGVKTA